MTWLGAILLSGCFLLFSIAFYELGRHDWRRHRHSTRPVKVEHFETPAGLRPTHVLCRCACGDASFTQVNLLHGTWTLADLGGVDSDAERLEQLVGLRPP